MALSVSTYIAPCYFSAHVPDITFSTDEQRVDVELVIDGDKVFSETFYPYGGRATVRDLRSLIEAQCEKWHNVHTQVAVEASTPGTQRIKT